MSVSYAIQFPDHFDDYDPEIEAKGLTGLKEGFTWQELYRSLHGNISLTPISGPHDIESRYFTEDAPYGLVPWSDIGKAIGVETPVIDSIVNIYNVVHEKDWRQRGRGSADLGLAGMSLAEIKAYVKTGERQGRDTAARRLELVDDVGAVTP